VTLLADRLQRIVPRGFAVFADGEMLRFSKHEGRIAGSSGSYVGANVDSRGSEVAPAEKLAAACEVALDQLQDYVDEASTEPWPGARTVPRAHAAVRGDKIRMWFGDEEDPVLECEPIDLASVMPEWKSDE